MEIGKSLKIISLTALVGVIFIGCGEKVTFKGQDYKVITSPITGKKWLDRNLGATQACTSSTDKACYGDYYQWGRLADGHEKASSSLTTSMVKDVSDVGNKFVVGYKDWTSSDNYGDVRTVQWAKKDGTGVCPVGFKVPTRAELIAETIGYSGSDNISTGAVKVTNSITAFQNFLKLSLSGGRHFSGQFMGEGLAGLYWVNSVDIFNEFWSDTMVISKDGVEIGGSERSYGASVRCVEIDTIAPQITSASSFSVPENQTKAFTIVAKDVSNITYSLEGIDSSFFNVDSKSGIVTFKTEPDYETKNSYSIIVKVKDSENNSSTQNVTINITDEIDKFTRDNKKEIVIDNFTKLQWQDDVTAKTTEVDWDTATSTCQNLTLGGYSDWRLPTNEELKSILKNRRISSEFVNFASSFYWSSTTSASDPSNAWNVSFFPIGADSWDGKTYGHYVRCVRAGQ